MSAGELARWTNPLLFAKQVASLDVLSGGRLTLGLGVGWLAEEYAAMGTPFSRRGARFDDYLAAVIKVWSGEVVAHEGEFVSWNNFKSYPTPAQKPHPPIIIGGSSKRALRRVVTAAERSCGWYAPSDTEASLREKLDELRRLAEEAGRPFESIEITANWRVGKHPDAPARLRDLGVHRLVALLGSTGESDPRKAIEKVVEAARDAT